MQTTSFSFKTGQILGFFAAMLFLLAAFVLPDQSASATSLVITAAVETDGGIVAPLNNINDGVNGRNVCPQNPSPGCDFASDDGIVRTHDRVRYTFTYQINNVDGTEVYGGDVFITSTLPIGMAWNIVPGFCQQPPSRISGDGVRTPSSMLCQLDPSTISITPGAGGTATSDLLFEATVLGQSTNGAVHTVAATIYDSIGTGEQTSNNVSITVSAAPRWDLEKQIQSAFTTDYNGEVVYRLEYRFFVQLWDNPNNTNINSRIGNEAVDLFRWVEDVSAISPNAELLGCFIGGGSSNVLPYARLSPTIPAERAFSEGGQISCLQSAPGEPITVEIHDADSSLNHVPTLAGSGIALPNDSKMASGGVVRMIVPASDVTSAGSLLTQSCAEQFSPITASGQSNFGEQSEGTGNNCASTTLLAGNASWTMFLTQSSGTWSDDVPGTASTVRAGDGYVSPEEQFAMAQRVGNGSDAALSNVQMCAVLDKATYGTVNTSLGQAAWFATSETSLTSYEGGVTVEYAGTYANTAWPPESFPAPANVEAECADEAGPWFASTNDLPGGPNAVTKVRVSLTDVLSPNQALAWWLELVAKDDGNSNGTVLPLFASYRADQINGGNWFSCIYDPVDAESGHLNSSPCGDRVLLSRAITSVQLESEFDNQINAVAAGGTVGFVVRPSFTSDGQAYNANVTARVTLPVGLSYIVGSAAQSGRATVPAISIDEQGRQTLIWDLGDQSTDAPIDPIEFRTQAGVDLYNGQELVLDAEIRSPADGSPLAQRSTGRSIFASVPAGLGISKLTHTPIVLPNEPISYTITIANHAGEPLNDTLDYIDIFPHNGDSRVPATSFDGALVLQKVTTASANTAIYYSSDQPSTISFDPKAASNEFGSGATNWCLGIAAGAATNGTNSCPATLGDVTAVRLIDQTTLNREQSTSFGVMLAPTGNREQNIYTNDANAAAPEVTFAVNSNDASAIVLEPSVGQYIWYDIDGNGSRDEAEPGIADVTVEISGVDDRAQPFIATTTTNEAGQYAFDFSGAGLHPGTYTVTVSSLPNLIVPTFDLDDGVSAEPQTINSSGRFTLNPGEDKLDVQFGYQPHGQIEGIAWDDLNGDGIFTADEPGIPNVQVVLCRSHGTNPTGAALYTACLDGETTSTDAAGRYQFAEIGLGTYYIEFVEIDGLFRSAASPVESASIQTRENGQVVSHADPQSGRTPDVEITWANPLMQLNAGYMQAAAIGNHIWIDGTAETANGIFDDFDDPIRGVTVILRNAANVELMRTETDANGYYAFTDLAPGDYSVQVVPLWGFDFMVPINRSAASNQIVTLVQTDGISDRFRLLPGVNRTDVGAAALVGHPTDLPENGQDSTRRVFMPLIIP